MTKPYKIVAGDQVLYEGDFANMGPAFDKHISKLFKDFDSTRNEQHTKNVVEYEVKNESSYAHKFFNALKERYPLLYESLTNMNADGKTGFELYTEHFVTLMTLFYSASLKGGSPTPPPFMREAEALAKADPEKFDANIEKLMTGEGNMNYLFEPREDTVVPAMIIAIASEIGKSLLAESFLLICLRHYDELAKDGNLIIKAENQDALQLFFNVKIPKGFNNQMNKDMKSQMNRDISEKAI